MLQIAPECKSGISIRIGSTSRFSKVAKQGITTMSALPHSTLKEILDKDPHHHVTKAITTWITSTLQRNIEDVVDAEISVENIEDTFVGRYTNRIYGIKPIYVTLRTG
jgi:hypothetical protein